MKYGSSLDLMVVRGLTLCILAIILAGYVTSAATTLATATVKTTARAAGTAARFTVDGARAASHSLSRPFRRNRQAEQPPAETYL